MLELKQKYTDFRGIERVESIFFHLDEHDVLEMQLSQKGGFAEWIERVQAKKDGDEMMKMFDIFLEKSYGVLSDDGTRFIRNPEVFADFKASPMYSDIFMKLCTDEQWAATFVKNVLPKELLERAKTAAPEQLAKIEALAAGKTE